jgi:hypothetical protein
LGVGGGYGFRVRVQEGFGRLFVGRRSHTGARARGERVAGEIGDRCAGEEEGKGEEGADSWDQLARERRERARRGAGSG